MSSFGLLSWGLESRKKEFETLSERGGCGRGFVENQYVFNEN